jgi:hypothetical protein
MDEHAAYRASGQAVLALLHGAPINHANIDGAVIDWPIGGEPRLDGEVMTDAVIGLAGVVAAERYRFGTAPPGGLTVSFNFTDDQLDDWRLVRELLSDVDPDDVGDSLFHLWSYVEDVVQAPDTWAAIVAVAEKLTRMPMEGREVARLSVEAAAPTLRRHGAPSPN